jgi:hypothetical protein
MIFANICGRRSITAGDETNKAKVP